MKNFSKLLVLISVSFLVTMCNKKEDRSKETILKGSTSILVDETLKPIMEDQIAVFQNDYKATITLIPKSEAEAINAFLKDTSRIIVLSRKLSTEETKAIENSNRTVKVTMFATDAIAFVSNKNSKDTVVALQDVIQFMQGKTPTNIKGLVFDNPNSSTVRYMNELAGIKEIPEKGVYSFKTNEEVIDFVSKNQGMIGVVGLNWLSQPSESIREVLNNIHILSVKSLTGDQYYFPSQNNLAEGTYPLARDLYIVNAQGAAALGLGFSSFIAGDRGQRIVLKSGLLPVRMPGRRIFNVEGTKTKKK